jgi:tripeptide aminopeptidase
MIDIKRLSETFRLLVGIDSLSGREGAVAKELEKILKALGAKTVFDDSFSQTGSDTGNLIARFPGNPSKEPLLLNAHMDTVGPGENIEIDFSNGVFSSRGETVLGADDKAGVAILIETLHVISENRLPCPPLEMVFTVCEEIGLVGAKHLDHSLLKARQGYCLDASGRGLLVTQAPAANRLEFTVFGKSAHAGIEPEKGINAIQTAARAIAGLELGRIDDETTCSIGIIQGGTASNIIPDRVRAKGEARSHNPEKLEAVTRKMVTAFEDAARDAREETGDSRLPFVEASVEADFPSIHIPESHPVVQTALKAASSLGIPLKTARAGGGSDANIFFSKGIHTAVMAIGMMNPHTCGETIAIDDMVQTARLLTEIAKEFGS